MTCKASSRKVGCNMGACHGALAGKGGFKLSLRGYDPEADFLTITREARGRRIEMADPGRSLILAKPTGRLAAQRRLEAEDCLARLSCDLADGSPAAPTAPQADDPQTANASAVLPRIGVAFAGAIRRRSSSTLTTTTAASST